MSAQVEHFAKLVAANLDLLKCDLLIMGDGPMHQSGRQTINFGNRGITSLTLTVYGAHGRSELVRRSAVGAQ